MRRELLVHFSFLISFFIFISLFKKWIALSYWPFWVGGVVGTLLPDLDHFLYVYLLGPQELTSQRVNFLLTRREITKTMDLLAATRYERTRLIFHTALFQLIFVVLSFLIISSSGNLFGRGLVLAFSLHLLIDQFMDITQVGNLSNWFRQVNVVLSKEQETMYWVANLLVVLVFGFLL